MKLIRSGTTTQVWEAIRTGESKRIALKVLMQKYRTSKNEIGQLKHEALVGEGLKKHKNVIQIFGYHDDQGYPLLAMELIPAKSLKIELRERREAMLPMLSPIIRGCAHGLEHLHNHGWVHCDIKPDNFLANGEGMAKIIDFSIAMKAKKPGGLSGMLGLGKTKNIRGTRSYMAPEQIRQKYPDIRSDIYGFGCMLFEVMAGKTPYTANTPDELLQKHLKASIPTLESCSDASPEFAALVGRMIAKKPENRVQTMSEFLHEFKKVQLFRAGKRPEGYQK